MIPEKEDFKTLPHLGHQNHTSRNPQERMGLYVAKTVLNDFVGKIPKTLPQKKAVQKPLKRKVSNTTSFRSSYLNG